MAIRIIPRLDIKGPNVVKGVHLEGLRVVGRPEWYAARYHHEGADELIYLDQVASLYGRNNLAEIVSRAAAEIFIPLTVGGGIRSVQDIQRLLRAGADKVAINTAAIRHPDLIHEGARAFGSQCIVLYVEAKQRGPGQYECLTDNARERTGLDVIEWVQRAVDLGAGEILLTSVDREGTGKGYDLDLVRTVADLVPVPVIASGGAGCAQHVLEAVVHGHADAVCMASLFHYAVIEDFAKSQMSFEEGNLEFLKGKLPIPTLGRRHITAMTIPNMKGYLASAGVACRQVQALEIQERSSTPIPQAYAVTCDHR